MVQKSHPVWAPRLAAFFLAALTAASAFYWIQHWPQGSNMAGRMTQAQALEPAPEASAASLSRWFGDATAVASPVALAPELSSRLKLVGVVNRHGRLGAALIAIDGKPEKSFRVGSPVLGGLMLKSLEPRRAMLAPSMGSPAALTLEMPVAAK